MRLINQSPYDTRHLRRVVVAAMRSGKKGSGWPPWWKTLRVYVVLERARVPELNWGPRLGQVHIRVPKLTGDEWVQILKDQPDDGRALTTHRFGSLAMAQLVGGNSSWIVGERYLRALPKVVPLRGTKQPGPPKDLIRERYDRALHLLASWLTKQKLAGTKVKLYRKRVAYYQKRLAARKEG